MTQTHTNPRIDAILAISMKIARLRDELREAEESLYTLLGYPVREQPAAVRGNPNSGAAKVREYVMANAGKPMSIDEIIKHNRHLDPASVRSTVHRLATGGLPGLHMVARGMYRFDQEVPFADPRVGVQHNREAQS